MQRSASATIPSPISMVARPWSLQRYVLKAGLLMLGGDFLLRLVFLVYNMGGGWEFSWADVPMALLVGLRFDLATLAIFNGLILILMALPFKGGLRGTKVLTWLLLGLHLPVALVNGADVVYYGFASKRLSHEFFSGGREAANFGTAEVLPYWWLVVLTLLVVAGQWWLLQRALRKVQPQQLPSFSAKFASWSFPLVLAGLLFLGFRGGLQTRPLRPANAFVTSSIFLGNVSLNSAYTIVQSMEIGNEEEVNFMPMTAAIDVSRKMVRNDFDGPFESEDYPLLRSTQFAEPERRYNVVILIVESLNANKLGCINGKPSQESLTPCLDSLANRGRLYTNFYSNGARSVQSLPAILNSTPDIFERPLIGSSFETNQHWGIGNMLSHRGYHTSFVCGGPNGTLGFDSFSKVSGFNHYYGRSDYTGPQAAVASNWGLHDRPTLKWLADMQHDFPKPFLNVWFSISNHHPFDLPTDCPSDIAGSKLSPMDKTVKYTDWALGQYFAQVMREDWAANTIFVVTGDHCFYFENDPDRGDVQNFHVPLLLLGPGIRPGTDDRTGSHIAIMPTLMELLRLKTRYAGVGVSMLSAQNEPFGITGVTGIETMAWRHRFVVSTFEKVLNSYRYTDGKWPMDGALPTTPEGKKMGVMLRAVYQVCSYMRRYNKQNLPRAMEN
jgi:phosphoglycerol transferase MdoB-like AlkP superfamily enzyme